MKNPNTKKRLQRRRNAERRTLIFVQMIKGQARVEGVRHASRRRRYWNPQQMRFTALPHPDVYPEAGTYEEPDIRP